MKTTVLYFLLFLMVSRLNAQEHRIDKTQGQIRLLDIGHITVKGHDQPYILITTENEKTVERDERAAGLKIISASGLQENTGIGLSALEDGETLTIRKVAKQETKYVVQVPKGVSVYYEHSSPHCSSLMLMGLKSGIEVSTLHNSISISSCSGPMVVNSVHGSIEASLDAWSPSTLVNLYSTHGTIDVSVPASTKASFELATEWGDLYTDLDLQYQSEEKEDMKHLNKERTVGTLNGGGQLISLTSVHSNIYLRKQK